MSKSLTLLLSAIVAISLAAPVLAVEQSTPPLSASTSVMAIGNPHPVSEARTASSARIEERRRADMAEWQALLGSQQPFPAMGVGGHPR